MKLPLAFVSRAPLVACLALLLTTARPVASDETRPLGEVAVQSDVMVPMRDGAAGHGRLSADQSRQGSPPLADDPHADALRQGGGARPTASTSPRMATWWSPRTRAAATGPKASGTCSPTTAPTASTLPTWIGEQPWSERQDRHDRHLLRRRHAARPGHGAMPAPDDRDSGRRDVEPGLRQHAQRRGVRAAVLELDLLDRRAERAAGRPATRPRPPSSSR